MDKTIGKKRPQHGSDELRGMQIDHAANELAAGQQYIMTLQDQSVLDYDDQDGEVLENIDLQQSFRQRIADRRKSKLQRHANSKLLPIDNDEDEDEWAQPSEAGQQMLSKYDDVEEVALEKKKARRIRIGENGAGSGANGGSEESKSKKSAMGNAESYFTKRVVGSDYYAAADEDPLAGGLAKSTKGFKKAAKVGSKRTRVNPLALADNAAQDDAEEDIISALEAQGDQTGHLATKKARQDAQLAAKAVEESESKKKRGNFNRAFDRVQQRNRDKNGSKNTTSAAESLFDLNDEDSVMQDDDYAMVEH